MLIGVAMAAVLNCAAVNAQVLGGLGGGLGGGLSGGLRDMNMTTQGALNGSLGGDLDTSTLRRTTRDTTERVTNRARNTTSAVRDRATARLIRREKVGETRQAATATTSAAAATAAGAVKDVQIEGAADMAGSATSNVSRDGINLAGAAQGAGSGAVNGASVAAAGVVEARRRARWRAVTRRMFLIQLQGPSEPAAHAERGRLSVWLVGRNRRRQLAANRARRAVVLLDAPKASDACGVFAAGARD